MLFLFGISNTLAQQPKVLRTHALSSPPPVQTSVPTTGTLDVVAIMVEFQPDSNRLTSGTGIFGADGMDGLPYLANQDDPRIDPLPHNQSYFEAHLEFAKNYYARSSDGQLTLDYRVLPDVYRLPKKMEEYSPIGENFTNEKLAELLEDAWAAVEANGGFDATGLDPDNTAFVVFHAGVGRDIELTGTSLDITPYDIPSLYFRKSDLQKLFADPAFEGFPINGGTFRVANSMILPRTESRRGEDISENEIVFPLSINGLLCASIGSHLGLPDLFNTETGEPAIGRFALMDGAGFFAYNGLIPPEPSAWEKVYLGWETPFDIDVNSGTVSLPAGSITQTDHGISIAKYSISSSEYFLIENRHRDPDLTDSASAQVTITIQTPDGNLVQRSFDNFDTEFIYQELDFDTLFPAGTFVDVDNFDWSLPGGLDVGDDGDEGTDDDRHLNGGILIWHIDEAVINQQLANGRVNADPHRRGIDLEEADGSQDIGFDIGLLDNSASFGYPYDFWWSGNNYRVITQTVTIDLNPDNEFGPETFPNNNSNSGAKSFFEFVDFSGNLPVADFRVSAVSSQDLGFELISFSQNQDSVYYTSDDDYWDYFPLGLNVADNLNDTVLVIPQRSGIQITDYNFVGDGPTVLFGGTTTQPIPIAPNFLVFSNLIGRTVGVRVLGSSSLAWPGWEVNTPISTGFVSSQDGVTVDLDFTSSSIDGTNGTEIQNTSGYEFRSEIVGGKFVGINGQTATFVGESVPGYTSSATDRFFAGTIKTNVSNLYYLFEDGRFSIVDPSQDEPITEIFDEEKAEWPAIVDEGHIYRVSKTENAILGYNLNGAVLANTPIFAPDSIQFIGTPLFADITGDDVQDILVVGQDDYSVNIFAYEMNGTKIEGFPLYVGAAIGKQTQPIHPVFYENKLYAISHTGDLRAWEFANFTTSQWPGRYGANPYNKVSADITLSNASGNTGFSVLNKEETYNWPNPANESTNLRFEVEAAGEVEITIINFSGRKVFERTIQAKGGGPEEISISTQNWGSGAYFAMIKATVNGLTESKLVKIGVAH